MKCFNIGNRQIPDIPYGCTLSPERMELYPGGILMLFEELFRKATGHDPYPYQKKIAISEDLPQLIDVPTGCGKTAVLAPNWLGRRRFASDIKGNLKYMRKFASSWPEREFVQELLAQLPCYHDLALLEKSDERTLRGSLTSIEEIEAELSDKGKTGSESREKEI